MYLYPKYLNSSYRMDEEPDEEPEEEPKEDKPASEALMLVKKMEKYFFESRSVYLWGGVDDKSAKDVVTKLLLLDADKPGEEIKFYINSPGGMVTSGMVVYVSLKILKSPVATINIGLSGSLCSILLCGVGKC
jgi:ATP-dependent Clp protease protease subunit